MASSNDITGDRLVSKTNNGSKYRDNFDLAFGKKETVEVEEKVCNNNCESCSCTEGDKE